MSKKTEKQKEQEKPKTEEKETPTEHDTASLIPGFNMADFEADPEDLEKYTQKQIITVPVGKPNDQVYFMAHPDLEKYTKEVWLFTNKEAESIGGRLYIVHKSLLGIPEMMNQAKLFTLHLCVKNGKNDPFLFPLPDPVYGRGYSWHVAQHEAVKIAQTRWVRMVANHSIGGYDVLKSQGVLNDPVWPKETLEQLIQIAFKENFLLPAEMRPDKDDHPIIKRLRGLV